MSDMTWWQEQRHGLQWRWIFLFNSFYCKYKLQFCSEQPQWIAPSESFPSTYYTNNNNNIYFYSLMWHSCKQKGEERILSRWLVTSEGRELW